MGGAREESCFFVMGQDDDKPRILRSLALVGQTRGEVRRLAGFDKKRHRVPDRVCGATQAFLEKLSADELKTEAEELFQAVREAFNYKRKDLSLSVGPGAARLEARDFVLEIRYFLDEEDASDYVVETLVDEVASVDLLDSEAFCGALGRRFDRVRCGLMPGVSVESVIDAVEEDESGATQVDYPSDCAWCTVTITGIDGEVFVDGAVLELRAARQGLPAELMGMMDAVSEQVGALRLKGGD